MLDATNKKLYTGFINNDPRGLFLLRQIWRLLLILHTMIFIDYLRDTRAELRHVTWPTRKEAINYTLIVLGISIATGLFLGLLDFVFAKFVSRFI